MSPRRPVDPSLSPEANRILRDELRAIEGPAADRQDPVAPPHAVHSPVVANLISARVGGVLTLITAVVVGAIIALASGATWVLIVALVVLCLGTAAVVGLVARLTGEVEHLDPDDAALLEEEGVGDPDRLLEELVEEADAQPGPQTRAQTPAAAVRAFLVAALVDNDGHAATNYLTPRARQEITALEPSGSRATPAQLLANLTLDGPRGTAITTEHAIDGLPLSITDNDDNRAQVTLQTAAGPRTLTVVNAFPHGDDADFNPPSTPWRIDAGIGALASSATAGGT
jgi:hypothetical protein